METNSDVTSPTLAERFPVGIEVKLVNGVRIGYGSASATTGLVHGYVSGFIVIEVAGTCIALKPADVRRADILHPECPSCSCAKKNKRVFPSLASRKQRSKSLLDDDDEAELDYSDV